MKVVCLIASVMLALAGAALITAGIATWGTDNHLVGFPYREMTGIGVGFLLLAAWVAVA